MAADLSPRLGANNLEVLVKHGVSVCMKELDMLLENFVQDGRMPGTVKLDEATELALLMQALPENAMKAMSDPDDLQRYQAVKDIARMRELEAKHGQNGHAPTG